MSRGQDMDLREGGGAHCVLLFASVACVTAVLPGQLPRASSVSMGLPPKGWL